ncbi:GIY-YIG nuclease family protein [bacterium]|nr:GIY-YIG nuclease family protein [bacterium]
MQIYQIINTITSKSYIGKSSNYIKRFERHKSNAKRKINRRFYDSINHHGVDNFKLVLIEDLGDVTAKVLNERESYWIKHFNTMIPFGYNMTSGGDGGNTIEFWPEDKKQELWERIASKNRGKQRSEECKLRMSEIAKEMTEEHRQKISKATIGRIFSEEHKYKMSEVSKNRVKQPMSGKHHSEYSKNKISEARKGKTYEEIFGDDFACKFKETLQARWVGNKNPNYVDFTVETKKEIMLLLSLSKINMYTIVSKFNMSKYKISQWLKTIGVDNYQHLFKKLNEEEWCVYWRSKYDEN